MDRAQTQRLIDRLALQADRQGPESLSPHELTIMLPWYAKGVIGNGGFKFFYEGKRNLREVGAAFRALGLSTPADACEAAEARIFGEVPRDQAARGRILKATKWEDLEELEDPIFDTSWPALLDAIGGYVEANAQLFGVEPPAVH